MNNSYSPKHTFFTSDTHFFHSRSIELCNRPFANVEEMNETLIANWNSIVKQNDVVFHLGDFCFGSISLWEKILSRLNGKIHLILGNHDIDHIHKLYAYFESVQIQTMINIEGNKILLNHYPFMCYNGCKRKVWQLHGDIHTQSDGTTNKVSQQQISVMYPTQYDVGVDYNQFRPISYEEVKQKILFQIENNK